MREKIYWTVKWLAAIIGLSIGILMLFDIINPIKGIGIPLLIIFLISGVILSIE